jgi:hypothetical protein
MEALTPVAMVVGAGCGGGSDGGRATVVVEQSLQSQPDEHLKVIGLQNLGKI